jgi:predicted DNA-binding WGR domain protein
MTITFYKQTDKSSRYYTVHDRQGNLFSPYTFTAVWGTVLQSGREKVFSFDSRKDMDKKLRFLMKKRIRGGYKVLYSFSRNNEYKEIFNLINVEQVG